MELTSEQRQRIEEEEGKRAAEERYRAEVRARLQQSDVPPKVSGFGNEERKSSPGLLLGVFVSSSELSSLG